MDNLQHRIDKIHGHKTLPTQDILMRARFHSKKFEIMKGDTTICAGNTFEELQNWEHENNITLYVPPGIGKAVSGYIVQYDSAHTFVNIVNLDYLNIYVFVENIHDIPPASILNYADSVLSRHLSNLV